jgi:hypothetical protein
VRVSQFLASAICLSKCLESVTLQGPEAPRAQEELGGKASGSLDGRQKAH